MIDAGRQYCDHCEYDITGLGVPGRLMRCPECGGDNRIGTTDLDAIRPPLPPWWFGCLHLGWPSLVLIPFGVSAWRVATPTAINTAIFVAGLVVFVAVARAIMLAFDHAKPSRLTHVAAITLLWAALGTLGIPVCLGALVAGLWQCVVLLNRLNGTPI